MKSDSTKKKVAEWLGYIFCEFSFLWFEKFDVPYRVKNWRWYHRVIFFVGRISYSAGCYFYDMSMKK